MNEDIEKLKAIEKKSELKRSKREEFWTKMGKSTDKQLQMNLSSNFSRMKETEAEGGFFGSLFASVLRGLLWGNYYVWDRSYTSKYDLETWQRMKIINYMYDRFTVRSASVSKRMAAIAYRPHEDHLANDSLEVWRA
jgi:hypothetical protein